MVLSALWIIGYLIIYPSVPLPMSQTHWKGIGMPGGCQPWTAICEMQQAEQELIQIRGSYLSKIRTSTMDELAADAGMMEFITRIGRVYFADNCASCHGNQGEGVASLRESVPPLCENPHRTDVQAIQGNIQSLTTHPFAYSKRHDETFSKIMAVYVDERVRGRCGSGQLN